MKEKKLEKAEMKESLLSGEALALNDAELDGVAGGLGMSQNTQEMEQVIQEFRTEFGTSEDIMAKCEDLLSHLPSSGTGSPSNDQSAFGEPETPEVQTGAEYNLLHNDASESLLKNLHNRGVF
ncbi:MAG TPA: hypothetical protein DCZ91_12685 [Lachnospiraceae bacterium]|nr:hypothetical protein [Lachnospiraceae bacterium]